MWREVPVQGIWTIIDLSRNGTQVDTVNLGKDKKRELKGGEEITLSNPSPAAPNAPHVK